MVILLKGKGKDVFRLISLTLFILFISLYVVGNSSYYDYEAMRKTRLTEEKIKEFESDIASGEKLDLSKYQEAEKDYDNLISTTTMNISQKLGETVSKSIDFIFKRVEKVMNQ
mgnify:CR=1 FL=1